MQVITQPTVISLIRTSGHRDPSTSTALRFRFMYDNVPKNISGSGLPETFFEFFLQNGRQAGRGAGAAAQRPSCLPLGISQETVDHIILKAVRKTIQSSQTAYDTLPL